MEIESKLIKKGVDHRFVRCPGCNTLAGGITVKKGKIVDHSGGLHIVEGKDNRFKCGHCDSIYEVVIKK